MELWGVEMWGVGLWDVGLWDVGTVLLVVPLVLWPAWARWSRTRSSAGVP